MARVDVSPSSRPTVSVGSAVEARSSVIGQDSRMELETALSDGVLVLTMNRPEARNALNRDLYRAIGEAFVNAESDSDVRVVALTGAGDKAFCAGMDLKAFAAGDPIGPGDGPGTTVFVERCYPK